MAGKLVIEVIRDDAGSFIMTDNKSTVYGVGDTLSEAAADWGSSFMDQFEFLIEVNAQLAPGLRKELLKQTKFLIDVGYLENIAENVPDDEGEITTT